MANRSLRFIALDKRTGEIVYVATPGGRPYDTAYASPLIATINGQRLLIAGSGDGGFHAIKPQTGEKVWSFVAAKRAINTGVVVKGTTVIVSHGDENLDSSRAGDDRRDRRQSQTGDIKQTKWAVKGMQFGFSSPVIDGDARLPDRERLEDAGVRHRDRQGALETAARDGSEGAAGAWPTARSTSAPRAASSSSCVRAPTAPRC